MEKKYSLTFPQQNIWLVNSLYNNSKVNLITGIININKGFDVDYCKEAINHIIKNNDAMRINILLDDKIPYQVVKEYQYENIDIVDMQNCSKNDIDKYINEYKKQDINILSKKLFEFKILKYEENKGAVLLKMHHIISDAWSYSKIIEQFVKYYTSLENNEAIGDLDVPGYIEFVNTTLDYKNSEKYKKDEEFWNEYLSDFEDKVTLKDRIKNINNTSSRYNVKLKKEINDKILEYCKENRISPYVMFLAALSVYLYRIKDKNDFVIGTPSLNRSNFKEKQMLGMFVSTLPLRVKIQENEKFLDVAHDIARNTMNIFRHQKYPYINTLKNIRSKNNNNNNLYGIILSYQNARVEFEDKEKYDTKWYENDFQNEDLQIHILDMDSTGILEINYDYLNELFDKIEIEYLHTRIMAIIENAILDKDIDVENIEIMSKEEKDKILYEFNDTKIDYPKDKSVIELFEEQVEKTPDNIALVFEDKKITYKELNERANSVAHYLIDKKQVKPNDIIAIKFNRSIEMIVAILGISKTRAAYLPIDPTFPEERINYIKNNSKSKFILDDLNEVNFSKKDNINIKFELSAPFYILYTSGSTGNPKGVVINNKNILNFVYGINKILNITDLNNVLSITTVSFDIFELELWLPLLNGAKMILASDKEKYNSYLLNKLCIKNNVDVIQTTPSVYNTLLFDQKNSIFLKHMKKIILGGEKLSYNLFNKLRNITDAEIYDGYGPTETTIYSSMKLLNKKISVGLPTPNTEVLIKDKKLRNLPIGIPGELCIAGDGVTDGYLYNDDLTKKSFINMNDKIWYKTGDLAIIDFDLEANILDRIDFQIKINGQRVEVEEIEKAIYNTNLVKECVVVLNNERLICVYTGNVKKDYILNIISNILPNYMIPKVFFNLDNIPKTSNGKVDRKKIQKMNILEDKSKITLPNTDIQKFLSSNIKDIIGKKNDFDVCSSFFEIGLDSLDIMRLIVKINDKYNIDITYSDIFQYDSILKIEKLIQNSKKKKRKVTENSYERSKYILTNVQTSIYNEYLKDENTILYNIPFELSVKNVVNKDKLIKSIITTLYNHKILFSEFSEKDNKVYCKIKKEIKYDINFLSCSEEEYKIKKRQFVKPLNLKLGEIFRIEAYEVNDTLKVLFDFSHIVVDGYSICILLNDIQEMYNYGTIQKEQVSFLNQVNRSFDSNDKKYFIDKFKSNNIETKIIPDYELRKRNKGDKITKEVGNLDIIKRYCKKNNITLNILMLSVFTLFLSSINKSNNNIIIGVSDIGRNFDTDMNTVGMFVKTIPYKIYIDKNITLEEYFKQIKLELINSTKHSNYTYEDLLFDLNKENSTKAFLNILYTFQEKGLPTIKLKDETCDISEIKTKTSKFDFSFEVMEKSNNFLKLNIEYSSVFSKEKIESFLSAIVKSLEFLISQKSSEKISEILETISNYKINKENMFRKLEEKCEIADKKERKKITNKELKILNIYKSVLNNNDFNIYDNFFEFGGDSLMLMRILSELSNMNINIKYSDLFKYKTVYDLCQFLTNEENIIENRLKKAEFQKINKLLESKDSNSDCIIQRKIKNVVLTGATGFLGIYLLKRLCFDEDIEKVYCIIRDKEYQKANLRLYNLLKFYFKENDIQKIKNKIIIIDANIVEEDCIEHYVDEKELEKIDIVINAAARVKHFGEETPFFDINVNAVNNLIKFCLKYNKELVHISTISVSGNYIEGKQIMQTNIIGNVEFNENSFYIGQELNNLYVYTKFIAEKNIYEAILKDGLKAKVIRVGNLTSSYLDGKFQVNVYENAFVQRIKTLINLKVIPENIKHFYFEFTPVDCSADAIVRLCKVKSSNNVFHVYNPNHVDMKRMIEFLKSIGVKIKIVSVDEFGHLVKYYLSNNYRMIEGIVTDINNNFELEYVDNIKISCKKTIKLLEKTSFKWPEIDNIYFTKFISYLIDIGFIDIGGER